MVSLSRATSWTRNFAKWAAILIAGFILLLVAFRVYDFVKKQIAPPPPPTVSFGKLPQIKFPQSSIDKNFSYSVDTVTGVLPIFPDRTKVYKIAADTPDLLALEKVTKKVQAVGFEGQGTNISGNLYQWSDNSSLSKKIVFDIFSLNFNLSSSFMQDPQVISAVNIPDETGAISTSENFLSNMSSLPQDIDKAKTKTSLFSIKNSALVPSTSLSNTQVIRVDFFQKNLDDLPIFYPNPKHSTISVLVGGGTFNPQILKVDFFHQNISSTSSTYPIITSEQALEKLKRGQTYIAAYEGTDSKISIKNVSLGFYVSDEKQDYAMPIVILEGSNGFVAYVSAVKDEWARLDSARQVEK